ncbi:MAG: 3-isopropylmalate dehydratase large subunit [Xanthomonadales bacterium]|nr:3-isopropylmalate dehydratase large subunit [Xanthomonadales bacterium]
MEQTLFDKIWNDHQVAELDDGSFLVYIDRVFLHERTGSVALSSLAESGRAVRNPAQVFGTVDHIIDTTPGRSDRTRMPGGEAFVRAMRELSRQAGIRFIDIHDRRQGISHLVSAEQGIALPGLTLVCPDSHTCTLGALGTLAWGIGSSECEHAMATETLRLKKPGQMQVRCDGELPAGVTAKDLALHLIGRHSAAGGRGFAIEFCGSTVERLPLAGRATLCNMAVEFSAFTALVAPDEKTLAYVEQRPLAPAGDQLASARQYWERLHTDPGARFDLQLTIDAADVAPTVTWGTSPQHAVAVDGRVPDPRHIADEQERRTTELAMAYMDLAPGTAVRDLAIDGAFIGSCTNSRLPDLRAAAAVLDGNRVADGITAICVPGSSAIKREAEAEGLDEVFRAAGFEWRESGCSLCFYAGGEGFPTGARVISSTNRNFEGRQGRGVRTHLASPATVAASAIAGRIADCRETTARP